MVGKESPTSEGIATASNIYDRLLVSLLVILIVVVPVVFVRASFSTFDIPKLVVFWVLAIAIAFVWIHRLGCSDSFRSGPNSLVVTSIAFVAALVVSSSVSSQPWVAFTGLTARGSGAVTYALCLVLLYAVYCFCHPRQLNTLVLAFACTNSLVGVYALLQAYGSDPFVWPEGILYVGPVFSTLGNPNFSAGYLAVTMPLLAWTAFGSRLHVLLRVCSAVGIAVSTVALAYLGSFQGDVAGLITIYVLGSWAWVRDPSERLVACAIALPATATVACVPLAMGSPGKGPLFLLIVALMLSAYLGWWWDKRPSVQPKVGGEADAVPSRFTSLLESRTWISALIAVVLAASGLIAFGDRILEEFESGLRHRLVFWETSLSIFSSNPIAGTGLETFSSHFITHRPRSHAIQHEFVFADSPHSVPLGLLSGGGLLVAASYMALMLIIFRAGVRSVRGSIGPDRLFYGAVFSAWGAYHLQSFVSMDVPGLVYTQWILAGILLARGARSGSPRMLGIRASSKSGARWIRCRESRWWSLGIASLLIVGLASLIGPLTAPLRADLVAYKAQEALDETDFQRAGEKLLHAIELQPRNGMYADGMALVYQESGLAELAFEELRRSATLQPGSPYAARNVAEFAAHLGRVDETKVWLERAVSVEPHGAELLTTAATLFVEIGSEDRAAQLLEDFESLQSPNWEAWRRASAVFQKLGDEASVKRADLCGHPDQASQGCWFLG